jgi:hypothetical protein
VLVVSAQLGDLTCNQAGTTSQVRRSESLNYVHELGQCLVGPIEVGQPAPGARKQLEGGDPLDRGGLSDASEDPLGDVSSALGIALLEGKRAEPYERGPMREGALEECSRLFDAALPDSQLTKSGETVGRHSGAHRLQVAKGGDELDLGGRPLAAAGEDLPVGAAADADQVAAIQALADRAHRLAPLGHPAEVAHPFAGGDEDAQRPCRRDGEHEILSD